MPSEIEQKTLINRNASASANKGSTAGMQDINDKFKKSEAEKITGMQNSGKYLITYSQFIIPKLFILTTVKPYGTTLANSNSRSSPASAPAPKPAKDCKLLPMILEDGKTFLCFIWASFDRVPTCPSAAQVKVNSPVKVINV